jgi:hypothetical protein
MKWLEIIELRSGPSNSKFIEDKLSSLIKELNKNSARQSIKIYCNANIDSDLSIHLLHDSHNANNKSPLSLQLVSALKEYGLINHSVWVERFNK